MKKYVVCISFLLFSVALCAQTDTKKVTPAEAEKNKTPEKKMVSSDDQTKSTQSQPSTTAKPRRGRPAEPPSPYVDGRAQMDETGFQFGYTPTNCTIFHSFFIKNVGTDTLDIVQVKPG